ncbi:16S rRNA (cytosine(967)-C(5))-methyltransferase RsmB [Sporolactobacillus vineae]|uniref:16S rRNA (cytosine(967)-C(5))-methyltransferase RsmB n=1 Tax=Sporolactobacillus vineae TaxID=444463 RepID=UPI00028896F4|nr:16S rRNA (cytosine(967)-C(5))-methyltransferase RsmB [Sporolactobacillus vineae]
MNRQSARETALDLLLSISKNKSYSQIALNEMLSSASLNGRDKALVTTLVYGVLQHSRTLDYILAFYVSGKKPDLWVDLLLRLSLYQKIYLDRIPDHAIVNEAARIAGKRGHHGIVGFVNAVLRRFLREGVPDLNRIQPESKRLSIQYSHPEWLLSLWAGQWDSDTAVKIAESDNQAPPSFVRVNRLHTDRHELEAILEQDGMQTEPGRLSPDCLEIKGGHIAGTRAFATGLMTIQDESSMLVADAVAPEKGMTVLDACAGPGGKTTHLGERMQNSGQIIALDLHEHKTKLIDQSAKRLGVTNIRTKAMDAREAGSFFSPASFDRLLLDVPCSGLGVIRRKPEIRWDKSPEDLGHLAEIQNALLERTSTLVRSGGWLVYSTCTVNRDENDRRLTGFLSRHPEFEWEPDFFRRLPEALKQCRVTPDSSMIQLFPFQFNTDGFFIGCLRRK